MSYKRDFMEIMQELIDGLNRTVTIRSVVDNTDGTYTLTVCDVKYAQPSYRVTINGEAYQIVSVTSDTVMTVRGTVLPVPGDFDLYQVYFFHGTPTETNLELDPEKDSARQTPMYWALENFTESFTDEPDNAIERETTIRLFALSKANFKKWKTRDFYAECIQPMRRLQAMVNAAMRADTTTFHTLDQEFKLTNHIRFGVYINNSGVEKSLFALQLSGCERSGVIRINNNPQCDNACADFGT